MDSPIDPINKSTEYVGLPKVDPWHESEKHKKKRFAHMLEDQIEEQKKRQDEASDEVVVTSRQDDDSPSEKHDEGHDSDEKAETPKARPVSTDEPVAHIDVKG